MCQKIYENNICVRHEEPVTVARTPFILCITKLIITHNYYNYIIHAMWNSC